MDIPSSTDDPLRVGILAVDGFALLSYASVVEPMRAANLLAGETLFAVRHFASEGTPSVSSGGAVIPTDATFTETSNLDLVMVVAGGNPLDFNNKTAFSWLRTLSRHGVTLGGVSGGPLILAKAGVMGGRRMTLHWEHAAVLGELDPDLLLERTLYVIDRDRMTCAGGTAALDMMHALITRRHGSDFAQRVSDWFIHTEVRPPGGPQRSGLVERYGTNNALIVKTIEVMEDNIATPLSLAQLAAIAGTSERHLIRLFTDDLGQATMRFYRDLRLTKAKNLLQTSTLTITEVALATGFLGSSHFTRAFRNAYGKTPSSFR